MGVDNEEVAIEADAKDGKPKKEILKKGVPENLVHEDVEDFGSLEKTSEDGAVANVDGGEAVAGDGKTADEMVNVKKQKTRKVVNL